MQYIVKTIFIFLGLTLFSFVANAQLSKEKLTIEEVYKSIEFAMPRVKEASFPALEVKITDFGARGDGFLKIPMPLPKRFNMFQKKEVEK